MYNIRFAPAASGKLHLGNLRIILVNYLVCKLFGLEKKMLLRVDFSSEASDSDEQNIIKSVKHLISVFNIDLEIGIAIQRNRFERYMEVFNILKEKNFVYCLNNVYYINIKSDYEGKIHIVRFCDLLLGKMYKSINFINNVVIYSQVKNLFFYNFMSVVDDIDFGIKYVVRGNDHIDNTYLQILIIQKITRALQMHNYVLPTFLHVPMCVCETGKISKSSKTNMSINECLLKFIFPQVIVKYLLNTDGNIKCIGKSQKNVNMCELENLNRCYLKKTDSLTIQQTILKVWNINMCVNFIENFKFFINSLSDLVKLNNLIISFNKQQFKINNKQKQQIKILNEKQNKQNLYNFVGFVFGYENIGKEIVNHIGINNIVK